MRLKTIELNHLKQKGSGRIIYARDGKFLSMGGTFPKNVQGILQYKIEKDIHKIDPKFLLNFSWLFNDIAPGK